jgi:hypothetical protein
MSSSDNYNIRFPGYFTHVKRHVASGVVASALKIASIPISGVIF